MTLFTKISYVTLALLLIAHPHVITGRMFSLSQASALSLANLLIGVVALAIYLLHARDAERTFLAKQKIEQALEISSERLSEAMTGDVGHRFNGGFQVRDG